MLRHVIGGNWKMNGNPDEAVLFMRRMKELGSSSAEADVVLFPPFTLLPLFAETASDAGIELGGQDLFWREKGAFTGEIAPSMLAEAGAEWFLAGHSERRHVIGETDETVRMKLASGLEAGLKGVLCVGEKREEREAGRTEEVVRRQVDSALGGLEAASPENLVIAYEPVWAIGTGLTATPDEAERMHSVLREWLASIMDADFAEGTRIQYGGSVNPGNAADILRRPSVNGALVGGASLTAESFMSIVRSVPAGGSRP